MPIASGGLRLGAPPTALAKAIFVPSAEKLGTQVLSKAAQAKERLENSLL